jgi:hypothetical protein
MAPTQQTALQNPTTLQSDSSSVFLYSSLFSPRLGSTVSHTEGKRVDSIYKNIMQSEIDREKVVMQGCIESVKQA